ASKVLQKKAETEPKIDFVWNAVVDRIERVPGIYPQTSTL
ncbi:unnamed protein product, partial [marine sediment metagenome]